MSSLTENRQFLREGSLAVGISLDPTDANIAIDTPGAVGAATGIVLPPDTLGNALLIRTRLKFKVTKDTESNSNKTKIDIYNLSQQTRNFLENENLKVRLNVGYNGVQSTLFLGDVVENGTRNRRDGPDIISTLECGDAEKVLTERHIDLSLGPGATLDQVIASATQSLGIIPSVIEGLIPKTWLQGFQFSGKVKDLLDQVIGNADAEWNIQDNELRITGTQSTTDETVVVVTPRTGLLGFPTKTKKGIEFKALINPLFRPGRRVKLESKQFTGLFGLSPTTPASAALFEAGNTVKIRKVVFNGDTHEGPWDAIVNCSAEEQSGAS